MSKEYEEFIPAPGMSIEEFDHITDGVEDHVFSAEYNARKESIMKKTNGTRAKTSHLGIKIAAAAAVLVIAAPFAVNAATGGAVEDLIGRIWGKGDKKDIPNHTVNYVEEGKVDKNGNTVSYDINMPKVEYVDIDPEDAARIMDGKVNFEPQTLKVGEYTFTVNAVATDERSAVVDYTIERKGGVDILIYSQFENESKGAFINDDQPYSYSIGNSSRIWVDLKNSTKDKIYCTEYIFTDDPANLKLTVKEYERSRNEMWAEDEPINPNDHIKETKTISINSSGTMSQATFTSAGGDSIKISPISMKFTGSKETLGDAFDPVYGCAIDSAGFLKITYKDGSEYLVWSEKYHDGIHPNDESKEVANDAYALGGHEANEFTVLFNRLADVSNIEKITVNETDFFAK